MKKIFLPFLLCCFVFQDVFTQIIVPEPIPRRPVNTNLFALDLQSNQINTKIIGQSATTTMDQVFYNPTDNQLQGYYIFPIPKEASIDYFSMFINGKETQGEILDADKAKKIYEDIVRKMQDPALLEYYNDALFRVRIFPIPPKSEQRVKLTYTQALNKESGTIEYVLPFKHQSNQAKAIGTASIKIDLDANGKLKNLYCPTHEVEIIRKGDSRATIGFEGKNIRSDMNFKLYYNTENAKIGASLLSFNNESEDGYFMLNLSPGFGEKQQTIKKDITFVLDCSGSMAGEKMEQAKEALSFCIENLNPGDHFNIVRFSTESGQLFEQPRLADQSNIIAARNFIKSLRAVGGTNIDEALAMALKQKTESQRPNYVIFLTDGKPTIGETNLEKLLEKVKSYNPKNTRIFTFGIGHEINTHLLDQLTIMTKAYRTYVAPEEDIELKVSDFYTKVASPILTDVKVEFGRKLGVSEVYPKQLSDIFKGSTLTLLGRYNGTGKEKITITGKVNGQTEMYSYELDFAKQNLANEFIPPLWGARAVGYLLDQIRLNGETPELKNEVIRLAKKHGIITPYTSYLILEDEIQSVSNRRMNQEDAIISNRTRNAQDFSVEEQKTRYQKSKDQSGAPGVEASEAIQEMEYLDNYAQSRNKNKSLEYADIQGNTQNLSDHIIHIQGRAVYKNNNEWMDAYIPEISGKPIRKERIQFNSEAYFELMRNVPESLEFLALGRNVRFFNKGVIYEVFE